MNTKGFPSAHRARRVEAAIHSGRMEGLDVTPATRTDAQEYAEGTISAQELRARVRVRYGLRSTPIDDTTNEDAA